MPGPLSSGSAGQPLSAHAFVVRASAPDSVTRAASPSITTSAPRIDTAIEQRGSRATLRPFRVPAPVWNQNVPDPHRVGKPLKLGLAGRHSARRGDYRVIYRIDDQRHLVTVLAIEHRSDIYRPREF
jgi:hypothetical protein